MGLVVKPMKKKAMPAAKARTGAHVPTRKAKGKVSGRTRDVEVGKAKGKGRRKAKPAGKSARITKPAGPAEELVDGQQERFCQLMADGRYSGRSCYAQAFGCENEASARTGAWRLLTKVDITDRIDWLKKQALKGWTCEKEEVMRMLYHAVVTPVGYVDEESPLAQEVTRDLIEKGEDAPDVLKVKVKMPGKVEAAKLLAQMQGWEKPQVDARDKAIDAMAEMVRMIRQGKAVEGAK